MNIQVITKHTETSKSVIYAFKKDDDLSKAIERLARVFGENIESIKADFKAEKGQVICIYQNGTKYYLLGLGEKNQSSVFISIFRSFFYKHKKDLRSEITLDLTCFDIMGFEIENITNGIYLAGYELGRFKTDDKKQGFFEDTGSKLNILVPEQISTSARVEAVRGKQTAETQIEMMKLGNAPANYKFPQTLADWAVESGKKYGYSVQVFDEIECEKIGLKALLAVAKGSEHPPRFIVIEYKPTNPKTKVGLVGKGVTFDTGGISIKTSANMHLMKSDMGGAAAVLGTIELAAKLGSNVHLIGVIPTTENSVDGFATKPGDVIGSYLGKTIEVIDTDAEGRLILADGLAYINKNFSPDIIIDLATLTGSVIGTLGYVAAGMFSNNEQLIKGLSIAGELTGEKVWQLPLWEEYETELKSDIADIKNYHGKPFAGAIVAAKFLEVFTEKHPAWVHLDIAGMAFLDSEYGTMKSASAFGVRLLSDWLRNL